MSEMHSVTRTVVILRDPFTGECYSYTRTYKPKSQHVHFPLPTPPITKRSEGPSLIQKTFDAASRTLCGGLGALQALAATQMLESAFLSGQTLTREQLLSQNNLVVSGLCGLAAMLVTRKSSDALIRGAQLGMIAEASRLVHTGKAAEMLQSASLKAQTLWQNFCSTRGEKICSATSWLANKAAEGKARITDFGCTLAQKTGRFQETLCPVTHPS